jgi:cell division protein ZapA
MAQVTLRINGYAYTVGCKDGEEEHLEAMGAEVGKRIDGIRAGAGPSGESRMLVMAALLMADEIFELRRQVEAGAAASPKDDHALSERLARMAQRAEEIAAGLEESE